MPKTDKYSEEILNAEIFFARLHNKFDKKIEDKVLIESKEKGISYVLCKVSDSAKTLRNWASQVKKERHRGISFLRLSKIPGKNILYGEFTTEHKTEELIMLHFTERFPNSAILVKFKTKVLIAQNGEIYEEAEREITSPLVPEEIDPFEKIWEIFYKSQYIPERKNMVYFKKMLPKKYWKDMKELQCFDFLR